MIAAEGSAAHLDSHPGLVNGVWAVRRDDRETGEPMNSELMFSKKSDEWSTPQDFWLELEQEFCFVVDAAATRENRKVHQYFGHAGEWCRPDCLGDALDNPWPITNVWCNPPYSLCASFVAKAAAERLRGVLTVMLIPSRTDTRYFHWYIWDRETHRPRHGVEIRFVKGRLKFGGASAGAPFPSLVVIFRP